MGGSRICRIDPHGDCQDVCGVVYEYADGLIHEHSGLSLPTGATTNSVAPSMARKATPC